MAGFMLFVWLISRRDGLSFSGSVDVGAKHERFTHIRDPGIGSRMGGPLSTTRIVDTAEMASKAVIREPLRDVGKASKNSGKVGVHDGEMTVEQFLEQQCVNIVKVRAVSVAPLAISIADTLSPVTL
jgi:hypothetical protein